MGEVYLPHYHFNEAMGISYKEQWIRAFAKSLRDFLANRQTTVQIYGEKILANFTGTRAVTRVSTIYAEVRCCKRR